MLRTFLASVAILFLALLTYFVTTPSFKHQLATVGLTDSSYSDDFGDASGVETLTNVLVSGGAASPDPEASSSVSPVDTSGTLAAGLIALFHFDGSVSNATTTSITASVLGNTVCNVSSISGLDQACSFDGSSGGISLGNIDVLEQQAGLTVAAWVKPTATAEVRRVIMEEDNVFTLQTQSTNGGVIGARLYNASVGVDSWASAPPTAGAWVHVAVVYNGSNVTTYINGVAQTPASLTGNTRGPVQGNVTIGGGVNSTDRVWNGLIDEVGIWNRALTTLELQSLSAGADEEVSYQLLSKVIDMGGTFTSITGTLTGTDLSGAVLEISPSGSGDWCTITSGEAVSASSCDISGETFYYRVTLTDVDSSISNVDFEWSNEEAEPASAVTYYVSPSGSDGNAGTAQAPFKTIQRAINLTTEPGTTIIVAAGTYNEQPVIYQKDGTAQDRMILKAAPGTTPVIDATAKAETFGLRVFHSAYWTIDGFEVTNVTGSGIQVEDGDHVIVKNIKSHDNTGTGIIVLASDDARIEYNEVYRNALGIKVSTETLDSVLVQSQRPIVRYNLVYKNILGGGGADGIDVNGGDGGIAEYNLVWQNYDDGIDNSSSSGGVEHASGIIFRYNATWLNGPTRACVGEADYAACVQCPENGDCGNGAGIKTSTNTGGDNLIHHNISFDNDSSGFDNDQEANWGPNRFYNNTAHNNAKGIALDMAGVTNLNSAAYVKNNILTGSRSPSAYGGDLRPSGTYSINSSDYNFIGDGLLPAGHDTHSLSGDPLLVNPDGDIDVDYGGNGGIAGKWQFIWDQIAYNFSLQEDSPAIDTGITITDATTTENVTNGYVGSAPDLGAFEYDPEGSAPTTHVITASAGSNGSISPTGSVSVVQGANRAFTITPSAGYNIASLVVDSVSVATSTTYTFTNVTTAHTIAVTFVAESVPDSGNGGGGGGGGGGGSSGSSSGSNNQSPTVVVGATTTITLSALPTFPPLTGLFAIYTRGAHVTQLQQMLAVDKFYTGAVTGYYDESTIKAVQAFQTQYNILKSGSPQTNGYGLSGPMTRAKLNQLYAATTIAPRATLAPLTSLFAVYTRGAHVTQLQQMLSLDRFYTGAITGYYDDATIKAVQAFQSKYNILQSGTPQTNGFGLSGPATRAKLNQIYATAPVTANAGVGTEIANQIRQLQAQLLNVLRNLGGLVGQ